MEINLFKEEDKRGIALSSSNHDTPSTSGSNNTSGGSSSNIGGSLRRQYSEVWNYFDYDERTCRVKCRSPGCGKEYSHSKPQTSSMMRHLRKAHFMDFNSSTNPPPPPPAPPTVIEPQRHQVSRSHRSICRKVAELFAVHNTSLKTMASVNGMQFNGYDLPNDRPSVRKLVEEFYYLAKNHVRNEIESLKAKGASFSVGFDEAVSPGKNRRYVNINLFCENEVMSLGMIRIKYLYSEMLLKEIIEERLHQFGVSLENDVVATVADRSTVIGSFKLWSPLNVSCLAHGVNLAVIDSLYRRTSKSKKLRVHPMHDSDSDNSSGNETDDDDYDHVPTSGQLFSYKYDGLNDNYELVCEKVRAIVKFMKRSPTRTAKLNMLVSQFEGRQEDKNLILDCGTDWNSLLKMLERFLLLRNAISVATSDENVFARLQLTDNEMSIISDLVNALHTISGIVEFLGKTTDLSKADRSIHVALQCLDRLGTEVAAKLRDNIRNRIKERRFHTMIHLFEFLKQPEFLNQDVDYLGETIDKTDIFHLAETIWNRLRNGRQPSQPSSSTTASSFPLHGDEVSVESLFESYVNNDAFYFQQSESQQHGGSDANISEDLELYSRNGKASYNVSRLYKMLQMVRPTSVEAERAFSAPGFFLKVFTARLSDDLINKRVFLKSYFYKHKS